MLASGAVPVIVLLFARLNMPESPHWLLKHGKKQKAEDIVHMFGDHVQVSQNEHS